MFEGLLRHAARVRYGWLMREPGVRASDAPVVRGGEAAAVRVLLLGSGVSSGWGIATHGLALTGQLQRELQVRLGVQCDVELVGDEVMDAALTEAWLGDRAEGGWDVVIVAIGATDAARLTAISAWERDVRALLSHLVSDLPDRVPLLVAGVPPMESIAPHRWLLTPVIVRHGLRLNEVTERLVAETGRALFVPLPPKATQEGRPWGSPQAYAPWAARLADVVIGELGDVRPQLRTSMSDGLRPLTVGLMEQSYEGGSARLSALVQRASRELGAGFAAFNLLDGDRAWIVADSAGLAMKSMPRALTYCAVTLRDGELEVPDFRRDPRFRNNPLLQILGLRSYAGVAVHAPDGDAIGTLCLFNGRTAGGIDMAALRAFAHEVEAELAATTASLSDDESEAVLSS